MFPILIRSLIGPYDASNAYAPPTNPHATTPNIIFPPPPPLARTPSISRVAVVAIHRLVVEALDSIVVVDDAVVVTDARRAVARATNRNMTPFPLRVRSSSSPIARASRGDASGP